MQQQGSLAPSGGKIALKYGLIFGLIQAIIATIILLLNALVLSSNTGAALGLGVLVFLTSLAAYFVAGVMASKQTARVGTGTLSGLWTGVFYGVIECIISIALFFSITLPRLTSHYNTVGYPSGLSSSTLRAALTVGGVGGPIFGLFLAIGIGAGIGALGGLLGRSQARKNAPAPLYQEQPYPGQPYPGQPYQSQPSYPGQPYNPYAQPDPNQQSGAPGQGSNPYNPNQPR